MLLALAERPVSSRGLTFCCSASAEPTSTTATTSTPTAVATAAAATTTVADHLSEAGVNLLLSLLEDIDKIAGLLLV